MIDRARLFTVGAAALFIAVLPSTARSETQAQVFRWASGYRVSAQLPGIGGRYGFIFDEESSPGHWRGRQLQRSGHTQSPWHGAALTISSDGFSLHLLERRRHRPIVLERSALGQTRLRRTGSRATRACALRDTGALSRRSASDPGTTVRLSPPRELSVFVVGEAGGLVNGERTARELLNAADALYASQLGLRLKMVGFRGLDSAAPPSEGLDRTLEQFRTDGPSRSWFGTANSYLLITAPRADREVIGLSYLGYLCRDEGLLSFSTAQRVEAPLQPLLIAHELAHLFGVRHDSAPNSLMRARISLGTSILSNESRSTLAQYVAEHGSCLPEVPRSTVAMGASTQARSVKFTLGLRSDQPGPCAIRVAGGGSPDDLAKPDLAGAVTIWEGGVESEGGFAVSYLRFAASRLTVPRRGASFFARAFASCADGSVATSDVATLTWPGTALGASKVGFSLRFIQRLAASLRRLR